MIIIGKDRQKKGIQSMFESDSHLKDPFGQNRLSLLDEHVFGAFGMSGFVGNCRKLSEHVRIPTSKRCNLLPRIIWMCETLLGIVGGCRVIACGTDSTPNTSVRVPHKLSPALPHLVHILRFVCVLAQNAGRQVGGMRLVLRHLWKQMGNLDPTNQTTKQTGFIPKKKKR